MSAYINTAKKGNFYMKKSAKPNNPPKTIFQQRLTDLRKQKKFNQEQLSEVLNVGRDTVIAWENGIIKGKENREDIFPSVNNLVALSDVLGVSTDYLLGRSDYTKVENKDISNIVGLSDNAINVLRDFKQSDSAGTKQVIDSLKHGKQPKHPLYALEIINFFLTSKHFKKFLAHFRNLSSDTYNVPIVNDGNNFKILPSYQCDNGDFLYFGCNPDYPADNISIQIDEDFRKEISRKLLHNCLNDISTDYQKSQEDYQQEIIKSFRH